MQHLFHVAPGASHAVAVPSERLDEVRAAGGWIWLDVVGFSDQEAADIGRRFGFDPITTEDVLDFSKFPKVEEYPGYSFVVGHALSTDDDQRRLLTVEYDVYLGDGFLVTFHRVDLPGFVWGREHVVIEGALSDDTPDLWWGRVAEAGSARFQPIVDGLQERIDRLEERAIVAEPSVPAEVLVLRRDVQTLRSIVIAQRDVYRVLARDEMAGTTRRGVRRFAHVNDDFTRLAEILDNSRSLLGSILETYRSTVAERANEVMKVLTVFSAIVLPLSLMAGIYGMNFAHMPELAWRWGYFGLLGLMAVTGVGLWVYFARRGFIGGPRIGAVPGLVGKGLVEFVKLTTKPATLLLDLTLTRGAGHKQEESS